MIPAPGALGGSLVAVPQEEGLQGRQGVGGLRPVASSTHSSAWTHFSSNLFSDYLGRADRGVYSIFTSIKHWHPSPFRTQGEAPPLPSSFLPIGWRTEGPMREGDTVWEAKWEYQGGGTWLPGSATQSASERGIDSGESSFIWLQVEQWTIIPPPFPLHIWHRSSLPPFHPHSLDFETLSTYETQRKTCARL